MTKNPYSTKNIAIKVANILKDHIGVEQAIQRSTLLWKIFNRENLKKYETQVAKDIAFGYSNRLKNALHYLRSKTHCFPISQRIGEYQYIFIASNMKEARIYQNVLDFNMKKMKAMQARVEKSIRDKWFNEDWDI